MPPVTIDVKEFFITGISVKTTNQNGRSQKEIGELWQKFFAENISSQIPNKVTDDIYCVYTDYGNNSEEFYLTILGCRVHSKNNIPGGLICKTHSCREIPVFYIRRQAP